MAMWSHAGVRPTRSSGAMGSRGSSRGELSDGPLKMAALVPRACGYVTSHGKRPLQMWVS